VTWVQGMFDDQLAHLTRVLKLGRIWAVNVGENFRTSREAWVTFCEALPDTVRRHLETVCIKYVGL